MDHRDTKSRRGSNTLVNKVGKRALLKYMKDKFHTLRGKGGLDVANINDNGVHFAM